MQASALTNDRRGVDADDFTLRVNLLEVGFGFFVEFFFVLRIHERTVQLDVVHGRSRERTTPEFFLRRNLDHIDASLGAVMTL